MIAEPGIYNGVSNAGYHADPVAGVSLSRSVGRLFIEASPAHVRAAHPRLSPGDKAYTDTPEKLFGSAVHAIVGGEADSVVMIDAEDRLKKDTREQIAAASAACLIPLPRPDYLRAVRCAEAVRDELAAYPDLAAIVERSKPEQTVVWQAGHQWFRVRPDFLSARPLDPVLELKTTNKFAVAEKWHKQFLITG